jgi:hypothetical protein
MTRDACTVLSGFRNALRSAFIERKTTYINYKILGAGLTFAFDYIMMKAAHHFGASLENENEGRIVKKNSGRLILILCSYSGSAGSNHGEI